MKESGSTIRLMAEALTSIWMELSIKENGEKINSTAMELRHGLMELGTKVITNMERSTVQEPLSGLMVPCILVSSIIITFTERESTHGAMAGSMRANGEITRCMVKVHSLGQMGEST